MDKCLASGAEDLGSIPSLSKFFFWPSATHWKVNETAEQASASRSRSLEGVLNRIQPIANTSYLTTAIDSIKHS